MLLKSAGTVFSLSISILSTSSLKLARSDFAAKLEVPTPAVSFKSAFVAYLDRSTSNFTFPSECLHGLENIDLFYIIYLHYAFFYISNY